VKTESSLETKVLTAVDRGGDKVRGGDRTRFWHPFSNMAVTAESEFVIDRGEGVWVWDDAGNRYLDATAGLWYCFAGWGRAELADAAAVQMKRLAAYSAYGDVANEPALLLASRIAQLSPIPNSVVFFTSGGSESIETAAKLVRRYWAVVGHPQRQLLVTREGSYHGMAGYGTSLAGIEMNARGYGELVPGVLRVASDDAGALEKVIREHPNKVAAFFGEPMRGAGGVYPPKENYWTEVQAICRKYDVLLVADEVITGFGRLGTWFGSSRFGIVPDVITGAKGVTSGYLPLGVVLCGERVQEPFWRGTAGFFRHGYTYSGHATVCAVGLANLKLLERERLPERACKLEPVLATALEQLRKNQLVEDVRCCGLTGAIELLPSARSRNPNVADMVVSEARRRGLLTRSLVGHSLQISPPLVITEMEIQQMCEIFDQAMQAVEKICN
jgi:putrescine---pyruvate transaminase